MRMNKSEFRISGDLELLFHIHVKTHKEYSDLIIYHIGHIPWILRY